MAHTAIGTVDTLIVRRFRQRLEEQLTSRVDHIARGFASEYATYREKVGEITALRLAHTLLEEVLDSVDEDETKERP